MPDMQDLDGSQPRIATERVVPALSSPMLHGALSEAFDEPWEITELVESEIVKPELVDDGPAERTAPPEQWFAPRRSDFELAIFVAAAIILAAGDIGLGVICGAFLVAAAAFRRLPFSFGEGFIGYRPDMGWPQGVQEDDDFHWSWKKVPGR
jgi:hypothetical protein